MGCRKLTYYPNPELKTVYVNKELTKGKSKKSLRRNYVFGFNGQEQDNEISGTGNSYTAEFWQYNPRLGRRWNIDPVDKPWESSYACFANNPLYFIDPKGDNVDDIHINSETGETKIIQTDDDFDRVFKDGEYKGNLEQGTGMLMFGSNAKVLDARGFEGSTYTTNEDGKITGFLGIVKSYEDASTLGAGLELVYEDLWSGHSDFKWLQTYSTNMEADEISFEFGDFDKIDADMPVPELPHRTNFPFFMKSSPSQANSHLNNFDAYFSDQPNRKKWASKIDRNISWTGELSVVGNSNGNAKKISTVNWGYKYNSTLKTTNQWYILGTQSSTFHNNAIPFNFNP